MTLLQDNELDDEDRKCVETHIRSCAKCRENYNRERWFLECIQKTGPLYVAPKSLHEQIRTNLNSRNVPLRAHADETAPQGASVVAWWHRRPAVPAPLKVSAMLAAMLLIALVALPGEGIGPSGDENADTFSKIAADVHRRHTLGQLPLEVVSNETEEIADWFEGKVPFSVTLPTFQQTSGQDKLYDLKGARLAGFNNDYLAYVAYNMQQRLVSLVITSGGLAKPSGKKVTTIRSLAFHHDSVGEFNVISWTHRGLTYALVFDVEASAEHSCLVCHQGTKDRDFIESIKL